MSDEPQQLPEPDPLASLKGPERVAILMMALGEQSAASLFRELDPKEVQKIGQAMAVLPNVTRSQIKAVLDRFVSDMADQTGLALGATDYIRNVLTSALGDEKAEGLMDRIMLGGASKRNLEFLKWMDPRSIAEIIRFEHPQIIAIVLSHLEGDQAAEILTMLPENMRSDILMRIATLEGISPAALMELDDIMERQASGSGGGKSSKVGGVRVAAGIMNNLEGTIEEKIMSDVKSLDTELGNQIEDLMFVFANLIDVDDRSLQVLLREVPADRLLMALKGADNDLRDKFFHNMSKRAAEMMRDDLEAMGPTKLSDVESAQKEILQIARRLAEEGKVSLGGGTEDYV
ncbi:MAG: flagellar motor switch protein FliG [Halothiobacillaceae bacterium]|jgi:flagellar motor switch protein FliG|nr:flagellar motor switch protein FliG [Halothiobacillaceae bacterium]